MFNFRRTNRTALPCFSRGIEEQPRSANPAIKEVIAKQLAQRTYPSRTVNQSSIGVVMNNVLGPTGAKSIRPKVDNNSIARCFKHLSSLR